MLFVQSWYERQVPVAGMSFKTAVSAALIALACAASASASGGSGAVSSTGKVGQLQIDKSTRADVVAFAGAPDAEVKERVLGFPNYDALGYGCSPTQAADTFTLGNSGPYCQTVFFVNVSQHTLEDFVTTSASYHEAHGVRIGTSVSVAQRLLHAQADRNCLVVLRVTTQKASLSISFTGGKADTFAVHSLLRTTGLFNCLR
jgi:hypothetical protein